ncbi:MAG TPA: hypothetical protein VF531_11125 [Bacillota bacterium]
MKKLLPISLTVMLILAVALSGCGGGKSSPANPESSNTTTIYAGIFNTGTTASLLKSTDGGNNFAELTSFAAGSAGTIWQIFGSANSIYVATSKGLAISTDNGATFNWYLSGDSVRSVYVSGTTIYAGVIAVSSATNRLAISNDGGKSWTVSLDSYQINTVHGSGSTICVATITGLAVSTDSGANFKLYDLAGDTVNSVYVSGGVIYATTNSGLSISSDNGSTFNTKLSGTTLASIAVSGSNVYTTSYNTATSSLELLVSHDSGDSFASKTTSDVSISGYPYLIWLSDSTVYVSGSTSGVSVSYDNGGSFTSVSGLSSLKVTSLFVK